MATILLDIHLELDPHEFARLTNPIRFLAELARDRAEEAALLKGAVLRHREPAEVYSRPGIEMPSGRSVVLVATRWVADGPEMSNG